MTTTDNLSIERKRFQYWVLNNWKAQHHNFSLKENGSYFYIAMEDAWQVWLAAKNDFINQMEEND